jgi:predicted methyltransferase
MTFQTRPIVLALVAAMTLGACTEPPPPAESVAPVTPIETAPEAAPEATPSAETALDAALANPARSPENMARDAWRHPRETLMFFGLGADQTVVEITPGGGWYTEILAPYLRDNGQWIGANFDPAKIENESARNSYIKSNDELRAKLAANPAAYDQTTLIEVDRAAPVFGAPGSADLVLTFRNVHNWIGNGSAQAMFDGFFAVLKPGGVLGVVEHRANADVAADDRSGYLGQEQVLAFATAAGFELAASSEINANPMDTKDHPNGVWTLPPALRLPEGDDGQKYRDIGESDRMTLKFVKPAASATQ